MAMEAINNVTVSNDVSKASKPASTPVSAPVEKEVKSAEKVSADVNAVSNQMPNTVAESTVKDTIKKTNDVMTSTRCEFSYHEETRRVSIKVVNKETDEVIREIPPEESLEMLEKMWEMAGILVDERR